MIEPWDTVSPISQNRSRAKCFENQFPSRKICVRFEASWASPSVPLRKPRSRFGL